jgi:hypothetical protein
LKAADLLKNSPYFQGHGILADGTLDPLKIIESSMELGLRAASFNFDVVTS